jgi:peptidoglycan/LPS O-acetylase OafA/YrhL
MLVSLERKSDEIGKMLLTRQPTSMLSQQAAALCCPKQARFVELDSLRGLAALTVVLGHLRLLWQGEVQPASPTLNLLFKILNPAGNGAVILFFVLSGFVLSLPAVAGRPQKYIVFLIRRIFRIYLPYLAALAVAVAAL